ncbi:MAG: fasciclin domain-containing protein [Actinobacteria bacterium]|nr:fasciclin domain-containing protein [Actinomycetota bacterium]
MKNRKKALAATAAAASAALALSAVAATSAQAGTKDLASVLTADHNRFDKNSGDFDVATEAVLAVLDAKPDSPVGVLADGKTKLTAFVPTDKGFMRTASDLTGKKVKSEKKAFKIVAGLGIDTVETVLLYHVVPGATIPAKKAVKADGAELDTAQGGTVEVMVSGKGRITLMDKVPDLRDPKVINKATDINKGNRQIAHGINRVLLPADL